MVGCFSKMLLFNKDAISCDIFHLHLYVIVLFAETYKVMIIGHFLTLRKTNQCHIGGFEIDENNQLVIVSVIDNLLKGASGQGVQNMNLMLGFKEEEGLK